MRQINSLSDANIVARDLQDRMKKVEVALNNLDPSTNVTNTTSEIVQIPEQFYEIVFTPSDSSLNNNTIIPKSYIVGLHRTGFPIAVYLYATTSPTGGPLSIDIMWNGNTKESVEYNILNTPLNLESGKNGPVFSQQLNSSINKKVIRPVFAHLSTVRVKIYSFNGAGGVTIAVVVRRMKNV